MAHGRTQLTIELRTPGVDDAATSPAFATVAADRATFDDSRLVAWRDGAAVASYPLNTVAGLRFGDVTADVAVITPGPPTDVTVPNGAPSPAATTSAATTPAATTPAAAHVPAGPLPPASGTGWTAGEDELLRTLDDQHAGLTMMILKTKRPMDEVIARLAELGIDATRR
jgi:hypothetical protein